MRSGVWRLAALGAPSHRGLRWRSKVTDFSGYQGRRDHQGRRSPARGRLLARCGSWRRDPPRHQEGAPPRGVRPLRRGSRYPRRRAHRVAGGRAPPAQDILHMIGDRVPRMP